VERILLLVERKPLKERKRLAERKPLKKRILLVGRKTLVERGVKV
jgi:hypothetical protein